MICWAIFHILFRDQIWISSIWSTCSSVISLPWKFFERKHWKLLYAKDQYKHHAFLSRVTLCLKYNSESGKCKQPTKSCLEQIPSVMGWKRVKSLLRSCTIQISDEVAYPLICSSERKEGFGAIYVETVGKHSYPVRMAEPESSTMVTITTQLCYFPSISWEVVI